MRYVPLVLSLAFIACAVAADTPAGESAKPKAPAAVAALKKHARAMEDAEAAYRKAALAAERVLTDELKAAQASVIKGGGPAALSEANAIDAELKASKARSDALNGKAQTFAIDARKDWQPTIEVAAGERVDITASGRWTPNRANATDTCGPEGHSGHFYLQGRVGTAEPFKVGEHLSLTAPAGGGVLELRMEDENHSDNGGALQVTITRPPAR